MKLAAKAPGLATGEHRYWRDYTCVVGVRKLCAIKKTLMSRKAIRQRLRGVDAEVPCQDLLGKGVRSVPAKWGLDAEP